MGMEAFRIDMHWQTSANVEDIVLCISEKFKVEPNYYIEKKLFSSKKQYLNYEYRIEDYIIVYFYEPKKYISFEACFSNFEHYISLIHQIYLLIQSKFEICIECKIIKTDPLVYSNFKNNIENFYRLNYEEFIKMWHIKNINLRPNKEFYDYIKKRR